VERDNTSGLYEICQVKNITVEKEVTARVYMKKEIM